MEKQAVPLIVPQQRNFPKKEEKTPRTCLEKLFQSGGEIGRVLGVRAVRIDLWRFCRGIKRRTITGRRGKHKLHGNRAGDGEQEAQG